MPEGPEIHIAARFINQVSDKHEFGGPIKKSAVSTKNPDVEFKAKSYNIRAEARGKELKVFLEDKNSADKKTHILFRFGMSGCFNFTSEDDLPKHAHLMFSTVGEKSRQVLSFVDYRRFGRWELEADWGKDRGPDPMFEYEEFRQNILDNLEAAAFNKPICETMLNQKYFNGIGNYLRAEILFRSKIKPFTKASDVLEPLIVKQEVEDKKPDVLDLCSIIPKEVLSLNKGKNYNPDSEQSDKSFSEWLQCYYVDGMKNLQDGHGRTIWFSGDPGPMVPRNAKVVGRKGGTGSKVPQSGVKKEEKEEKVKSVKREVKEESSKAKKTKKDPESKPVKEEKIKVEKEEKSTRKSKRRKNKK